jgi:hypothetical protein
VHRVGVASTIEHIVAGAAMELIGSRSAVQLVVSAKAG